MVVTEGSQLNLLAKRVYHSNKHTTLEKTRLLEFMRGGGEPLLVEADLDDLTLFFGFEPGPSVDLRTSSTIRVVPRAVLSPNITYIETLKKLILFNKLARDEKFKAFAWFKLPWTAGEWVEIVWYSYFRDEVSILFDDGGYKIIPRKELLP